MAISRELVLELSDLDTISVQCARCKARVMLSVKAIVDADEKRDVLTQCLWCGEDWGAIRRAVRGYREALARLQEFKVSFYVSNRDEAAKGEPCKPRE